MERNIVRIKNLEVEVFKSLFNNKLDIRSSISENMMKGLYHVAPNLPDVSLEHLIDFRNSEITSFRVYRDSLQEAINQSKFMSEKQIVEAFEDLVRPKLTKLDNVYEKKQRTIEKVTKRNIMKALVPIQIGLFANYIPFNYSDIVSAVGGITGISSFLLSLGFGIKDSFSDPEEVILDDIYFFMEGKSFITPNYFV